MATSEIENEGKSAGQSDEEILRVARQRFALAAEAEAEWRADALDDYNFRKGEQWPDDIKRARDLDSRPCLTINKLIQPVHQVVNEARQNRPAIKVSPVDDAADVDTAKVLQGLIRHIEYASNADIAYDTAFEAAVVGGRGWWRILTDYCDDLSFDQDIQIKRIRNVFSVYKDPTAQEPDGSDMNWAFVVEDMPEDEFKAQYPRSEISGIENWSSLGDRSYGWVTAKSVRLAEYYYIDYKDVDLVLLPGNKTMIKSDLSKDFDTSTIVSERKGKVPTVRWIKTNGIEILERTNVPCRWIPLIEVIGDEVDVDGKVTLEGIIRQAKDPQRMHNYWASAETEAIALAPRTPWLLAEGQIEGHEVAWKTANTRNHAYLPYKPTTIAGQQAPPPQRNTFEPAVQAITQARVMSADDIKATTGIYDASLGNKSNENSGIAIQRRNVQAQTSNYHFMDNLSRSIRQCGRCLVDMIPRVYDTQRAVRIIGEDGETSVVEINQALGQAMGQSQADQKSQYNLNAGTYDVTIDSGPTYQTKRQEAVASMMDFIKAFPPAAQVIGDLIARNMDIPAAKEIADRLKRTLPPGVGDDPNDKRQPIPPQVQAQLQQMDQMIQQLTAHLNAANDELDSKKLDLESKERIALIQAQTELSKTMAQIDAKNSQLLFIKDMEAIKHRLELLHANQPIDSETAGDTAAQISPEQQQPTGGPSPGTPMGAP